MNVSTCRSCGAKIIWAKTPAGKATPLNADPCPEGNIVLDANGCTGPAKAGDQADTRVRYMTHWGTCPQAKTWSKSGKPATQPAQSREESDE